jgi:hypothetical protein
LVECHVGANNLPLVGVALHLLLLLQVILLDNLVIFPCRLDLLFTLSLPLLQGELTGGSSLFFLLHFIVLSLLDISQHFLLPLLGSLHHLDFFGREVVVVVRRREGAQRSWLLGRHGCCEQVRVLCLSRCLLESTQVDSL